MLLFAPAPAEGVAAPLAAAPAPYNFLFSSSMRFKRSSCVVAADVEGGFALGFNTALPVFGMSVPDEVAIPVMFIFHVFIFHVDGKFETNKNEICSKTM